MLLGGLPTALHKWNNFNLLTDCRSVSLLLQVCNLGGGFFFLFFDAQFTFNAHNKNCFFTTQRYFQT